MEDAIQTLVKVYLKSSKGKENLGKNDFQKLVKTQFSNILTGTESNDAINEMSKGLDANQDGKLGFEEYMKLIGYLAVSLSEQQTLANEDPAQKAATGQVAQSSPDKGEEKAEANAEAKEKAKPEVKPEVKLEVKPEVKPEVKEATAVASAAVTSAEVKLEANAKPKVEAEVEVKAGGVTQPEAPKKEATAAAEVVVTTTTTVMEAKKEVKVEETKEKANEKLPSAEEEKPKETTS